MRLEVAPLPHLFEGPGRAARAITKLEKATAEIALSPFVEERMKSVTMVFQRCRFMGKILLARARTHKTLALARARTNKTMAKILLVLVSGTVWETSFLQ